MRLLRGMHPAGVPILTEAGRTAEARQHHRRFAALQAVAGAVAYLPGYSEALAAGTGGAFCRTHPLYPAYAAALRAEEKAEADLVRCLFGNPFRSVALGPAWLTANDGLVVKVAESIDQRRAFDELPLLADALGDCGCSNHQVLRHCRGAGEHARGCFVLDHLLQKA